MGPWTMGRAPPPGHRGQRPPRAARSPRPASGCPRHLPEGWHDVISASRTRHDDSSVQAELAAQPWQPAVRTRNPWVSNTTQQCCCTRYPAPRAQAAGGLRRAAHPWLRQRAKRSVQRFVFGVLFSSEEIVNSGYSWEKNPEAGTWLAARAVMDPRWLARTLRRRWRR
jgi:hypothetical protein